MAERIFSDILETCGGTPLVRIGRMNRGGAEVLAKVEFFNPGGSVKDRVGVAMIEEAERSGKLAPGGLVIEPTSGNTGIGLALAAAVKGYRLILTMPDTMSVERRKLLAVYGARIVLTPGDEGLTGAIKKAEALQAENPGSFIPQQFKNPANPYAHYASTGPEIWRDTGGRIDAFVSGVGTGGTLTGTGRFLKEKDPRVSLVAVEPDTSAVLSGEPAGPHKLQGIGAGFVPETVDKSIIDRIVKVGAEEAGKRPARRRRRRDCSSASAAARRSLRPCVLRRNRILPGNASSCCCRTPASAIFRPGFSKKSEHHEERA